MIYRAIRIFCSILFLGLFLHQDSAGQTYPSLNISLISIWDDPGFSAEPQLGIKYNGIWGYHDTTNNKTYGIIGSQKGTHFIEITDPLNPVERDYIPGFRDSCIWREIKTYRNYVYIVSDDNPNHFQIGDLSTLPDSVRIIHDSDSLFARAHALYINGNKLYCSSVKGGAVGFSMLTVFDLNDPEHPQIMRKIEQDSVPFSQVHDMFVRNDTVYVSAGYDGLFVYKFTGETFEALGSLTTYPQKGYNHSSFLSADGKTLIMTDEVPMGMMVKNVDVTDLSDMDVRYLFESSDSATAHNPYTKYGLSFIAYYKDGVQVFDVSRVNYATRVGYFDTYPNTNYLGNAYAGNWGIYTELPSDIILASDMQRGMFILDVSALKMNASIEDKQIPQFKVNYANNHVLLNIPGPGLLSIHDITGRIVYLKEINSLTQMAMPDDVIPGIYIASFTSPDSITKSIKIRIIR